MDLCKVCQKIDIRAMYEALIELNKRRGPTILEFCFGSPGGGIPRDVPRHQHHSNIVDIERHSQSCMLCKLIWDNWVRLMFGQVDNPTPAQIRAWRRNPTPAEIRRWMAENPRRLSGRIQLALVDIKAYSGDQTAQGDGAKATLHSPHLFVETPGKDLWDEYSTMWSEWLQFELYHAGIGMSEARGSNGWPSKRKIHAVQEARTLPSGYIEQLPLMRGIFAHAGSQECFVYAGDWLKNCLASHVACQRRAEASFLLPSRVIDVGGLDKPPTLHIAAVDEVGSWACLSYCWGGVSNFVLSQTTYEALCEGQPLESFPATIRDAIVVTRALGLRYLWVDSICIIKQDSREDWEREAPKMAGIYANGLLTIIAANASSAADGILHPRDSGPTCALQWRSEDFEVHRDEIHAMRDQAFVYLRRHIADQKTVKKLALPTKELSRWSTRGWTFQEGLLSWRTLTYLNGQMSWHCLTHEAWESGFTPSKTSETEAIHHHFDSNRLLKTLLHGQVHIPIAGTSSANTIYEEWYKIIETYSERTLTRGSDRLPAIAGLAKIWQMQVKDTYCAGLWEKDLLHGLLWERVYGSSKPESDDYSMFNSDFPSWSWISCNDRVKFEPRVPDAIRSNSARVEGVHLDHTCSIYGAVESGELVVMAHCYLTNSTKASQSKDALSQRFQDRLAEHFDRPWDEETRRRYIPGIGQQYAVILVTRTDHPEQLTRFYFLILQAVQDLGRLARGQPRRYRRVSRLDISTPNYAGTPEDRVVDELKKTPWPRRTLTII